MYSELVVIDTTIVLAPLEKTIKIFHLLVNCWSQEDMQSCFLLRCLVNLTNRKRCSRRGRRVGEGRQHTGGGRQTNLDEILSV